VILSRQKKERGGSQDNTKENKQGISYMKKHKHPKRKVNRKVVILNTKTGKRAFPITPTPMPKFWPRSVSYLVGTRCSFSEDKAAGM